jgi:hypothetical protein
MKKRPTLKIIGQIQKELQLGELARYQEIVRKEITKNDNLLKSLGMVDGIQKIQEQLKQTLEPYKNLLSNSHISEKDYLIIPPQTISRDEQMRYIIQEELEKHFSKKENQKTITIDSKGTVSLGDKEFELYSGGIEIIRILSNHNQYIETYEIIDKSKTYTTSESLRKSIAKTNKKINKNLKLKDNLILGKRGSGYMINSIYKVIFKK